MNRGVPPTELKALTGEFTPPGMTVHASAKSFADTSVRDMATSVPAGHKPSTTGCRSDRSPHPQPPSARLLYTNVEKLCQQPCARRASALRRHDENGVIGLVGQLAEVALDGAARSFPV